MTFSIEWFVPLAAAALAAGVVRGFSGFGSALIFVPAAAAFVGPIQAVLVLFLIDTLMALPLLPAAARNCTWREAAPLALGATVMIPVGTYFLVVLDPTALRWAMSALALLAVTILASGWRYHRPPGTALSAMVGLASGLLGGLTSFYGPPMVLFWLGGQSASTTVRANTIIILFTTALVAGATYAVYDIYTWSAVYQAAFLVPLYGAAIWMGTRLFRRASERIFRHIAYLVIAIAAISGAPLFDGLLN